MSMTLEEAIKLLKQYQGYDPMFPDGETLKHAFDLTDETVDTLLSALRPVSREQVERVWPGCNRCKDPDTAIAWERWGHQYCSQCGRPLTPEAWEELRKRLEALNNDKK